MYAVIDAVDRLGKRAFGRFDWMCREEVNYFVALTHDAAAGVERALALKGNGSTQPMRTDAWGPNLLAEGAIFLLRPNGAVGAVSN